MEKEEINTEKKKDEGLGCAGWGCLLVIGAVFSIPFYLIKGNESHFKFCGTYVKWHCDSDLWSHIASIELTVQLWICYLILLALVLAAIYFIVKKVIRPIAGFFNKQSKK